MNSIRYLGWLVVRRLRRRDSGALMTALGLTAATAVLAVVLAGATIASDRATSQAVERIPTTARSLRASWFGVPASPAEQHAALDRKVRSALVDVTGDGPTALALFRESTIAGRFVGLAGVDGLAPHVILRSGRLPRRCSPGRCEVLRLRGRGALPNAPGLRLVEVGTATLRSRQLFGDFLEPTDNATADAEAAPALRESGRYHRPSPAPLVVAEGIEALVSSPAVARTYRTYAWVWPLAAGTPRLWEVDGLIGRVERARAELATYSGSFAVNIPEEELRSAERRAEVAGRRLLIVGGEVAALLLAFALLAARGLRRDLEAARTRLTWYGARTWQLALLTGLESAAVAAVSVVAGWLLGSAAGAWAASLADAPVASVLAESTLSPRGLGLALVAAAVTTALTALVVSLRSRSQARVGVAEAAGAAAAIVIGVALLGGAVDDERLASSDDSATLLLLLPGLVALVAAVAVARLFRVVARLVADRSRGPLSSRLAALSLARSPGAAVVTVSFLTIAFGLALLAEAYRATLVRGEREQAAFQVPLDVVVREDLSSLVRVFDAAPHERFRALAGSGGGAYPILRATGSAGRAERVTGVTVLGLDRGVVERLEVWRREWADGADRDEVADRIAPGEDVGLRGVELAGDELALTVGPSLLGFVAIVETPDGRFERVELGRARADSSTRLSARLRSRSRLVSLELVPPPRLIEGGADAGVAFDGVVRLRGLLARQLGTWTGVDGATVRPSGAGVDIRFVLTPQRRSRLRAQQVTDETPPAVLATPRLAELAGGGGGLLPVQVGGSIVPVRVAGVVDRFPGTSGDVIVGDRGALRTAINTAAPGAAVENEVWLAVAEDRGEDLSEALERAPFHVLASSARAELEADARRDPLARATLLALGGAALLALVLAATGLALAVRADMRDERGELDELEAQGASPSLLRRVVRLRALALTVGGLVAGALTGALLVALVTKVVSVTARGGFAEPPLAATVELAVVAAGLAAFGLLAGALVAVGTHRAFASARLPAVREDG